MSNVSRDIAISNSVNSGNSTVGGNSNVIGTMTVGGTATAADPTDPTHLATKAYVDSAVQNYSEASGAFTYTTSPGHSPIPHKPSRLSELALQSLYKG